MSPTPNSESSAVSTIMLDTETAALLDGLNGSATAWATSDSGVGFSVVPAVYWRRRFRAVRAEKIRLALLTTEVEARLAISRGETDEARAANEALVGEMARLGETLSATRTQAEERFAALTAAAADAERLRAEADGQRVALAATEVENERLRAEADSLRSALTLARAEGERQRVALAAAGVESERLRAEIAAEAAELAAARADADRWRVAVVHYRDALTATRASLTWRAAHRASVLMAPARRLARRLLPGVVL